MKNIAVGCDHGGFALKQCVVDVLTQLGASVVDFGTFDASSVDYPVYGEKVAQAVSCGDCDAGVVICGTGIGISIAANKVKGIRAAVVTSVDTARLAKQHNNANVIALGGRVLNCDQARDIVRAWYEAQFEGGRHTRRLEEIAAIEDKNFK